MLSAMVIMDQDSGSVNKTPQLNAFLYKSSLGDGVSPQQ